MGSSVLRNARHELYAQGVASGLAKIEAYGLAGFSNKSPNCFRHLDGRPDIQNRIKQLLEHASRRAELTRKDILDRIFQDWELARKLGQVPAALKAAELMGKELHKMFVERREVGGAGDFDNKTEDELKAIVREGLKDLGWEEENTPPSTSIN